MGHTHYWYLRTTGREAVEKRLGTILEDFARLLPSGPSGGTERGGRAYDG